MAISDQELRELNDREAILREVFERVQNSEHWKGPIDAMVDYCEGFSPEIIMDAVMYFTATEADVSDEGNGFMHVTAPGYWEGPAA